MFFLMFYGTQRTLRPALGAYLQGLVDNLQRILGAQRRLEGVFNQGDVGVFLRVLNATQLLGHGEKVGRNLIGVHQQHSTAGSREIESGRVQCHAGSDANRMLHGYL